MSSHKVLKVVALSGHLHGQIRCSKFCGDQVISKYKVPRHFFVYMNKYRTIKSLKDNIDLEIAAIFMDMLQYIFTSL